MHKTLALSLMTLLLPLEATACGDMREDFEQYVATAEHIVLAGVISYSEPGYREFIANAAENFDPEQGLPIDISRRIFEFETEILHVFKGGESAPNRYFQSPCMGTVKVGSLFIIFSDETAEGHQAVSFDAHQFPEILDDLNQHFGVAQE